MFLSFHVGGLATDTAVPVKAKPTWCQAPDGTYNGNLGQRAATHQARAAGVWITAKTENYAKSVDNSRAPGIHKGFTQS